MCPVGARRRRQEALEPPGQVGLIGESQVRGDLGEGLTLEDPRPRSVQSAADDVGMGRDPDDRRERAGEVPRAPPQLRRGGGERDRFGQVGVEIGTKRVGEFVVRPIRPRRHRLAERGSDPGRDGHEAVLGLELILAAHESVVEIGDESPQCRIGQQRLIDGRADERFGQDRGLDVENALPVAGRTARSPVVDDIRRQDGEPGWIRAARSPAELVLDPAGVDDEHRPRVVGVRRIGVVRELGVEDLADAGDERGPGPDDAPIGSCLHRRIVQDVAPVAGHGGLMEELIALVGFSVISVITPGPNNLILWATGAEFGFRRAVPHILGTALGIGTMAIASVVGLAALVAVVPQLSFLMKVAGSIYLLYLAWQVAGAGALAGGRSARPLSVLQGAAFQLVNPKAWAFALSAVTTFRPVELASLSGGLVVAAVMMIVIVPASSVWPLAGGAINRRLVDPRSRRIVSGLLAALLALTVLAIWM
jgi:threonine/homoserine/homoserine lactone efflux protein